MAVEFINATQTYEIGAFISIPFFLGLLIYLYGIINYLQNLRAYLYLFLMYIGDILMYIGIGKKEVVQEVLNSTSVLILEKTYVSTIYMQLAFFLTAVSILLGVLAAIIYLISKLDEWFGKREKKKEEEWKYFKEDKE